MAVVVKPTIDFSGTTNPASQAVLVNSLVGRTSPLTNGVIEAPAWETLTDGTSSGGQFAYPHGG